MTERNIFNIPASAPFAETLAAGVIARFGASPLSLADITIYLPTRRAARSFGDVFARVLGGAALLPQFRALGGVSAEEAAFDGSHAALEIAPAMTPLRRRLLLASMVRRWHLAERSSELAFAKALSHADALAALLDEIETRGVDLNALDGLVGGVLAKHWADVRDFLLLLRDAWPGIVEAELTLSPSRYRNLALAALSARLARETDRVVIAAGSTGSIPATADLLATIASLPKGAVVLPGLDPSLDDTAWASIADDPAHPQYGLKQLLERFDVPRHNVREWAEPRARNVARESLVTEALRPAPTTDAWRRLADSPTQAVEDGLKGMAFVEAANPAEEAAVVALMLREALERREETAALVTPDRALARRVAAELTRFGIEVDDSAGGPLARAPAGTFLLLIAEAAASEFSPVPLLALLKHPLASLGNDRGAFLRRVRDLDHALRGPRPDAGLDGIARAIATKEGLSAWFASVADTLRALEQLSGLPRAPIGALLDAHLDAAERLSRGTKGGARVWEHDDGAVASELCASLREAVTDTPDIEPVGYAGLFRLLAEETAVRPTYGRHPRLHILGPLEARLQRFDLVILGSLNEGTWPHAAAADPWLSRPMRSALGLESPERAIGLSAHDFASLAQQPRVVLTRAAKKEGAQTVGSRWLQRLQQLVKGLELSRKLVPEIDWVGIARAVAEVGPPARTERPSPAPPVPLRPRKLSVTEIETWRRDPYAIYARRVLDLRKLDPLDAPVGPLERGNVVHRALEEFVTRYPNELPPDAASRLIEIGERLFREQGIPHALLAIWKPRFAHAAEWFVAMEREQRTQILRSHVEVIGNLAFAGPAGPFLLHGRADRIDILKDGGACIIDYKTGAPPTTEQLGALLAPQLPLEGAIVAEGGFEGLPRLVPSELVYVQFSGGLRPGDWRKANVDAAAISSQARDWLARRIARYDDPATGYISRAIPYRSDIHGDYDHLARVGEWVPEPPEDWQT